MFLKPQILQQPKHLKYQQKGINLPSLSRNCCNMPLLCHKASCARAVRTEPLCDHAWVLYSFCPGSVITRGSETRAQGQVTRGSPEGTGEGGIGAWESGVRRWAGWADPAFPWKRGGLSAEGRHIRHRGAREG